MFAVELRRLAGRRLVQVLAGGLLLLVAGWVVLLWSTPAATAPPSAAAPLAGASGLLAIAGFLVGADFVGADWAAGTIAMLLTWEPRRGRVVAAKAAAVAGVWGLLSAVMLAAVALAGPARAVATRRAPDLGGVWSAVGPLGVRGVVLATAAALAGYALAGALRSTAAALAVALAYAVAGEVAVADRWPAARPWLLGPTAASWLHGGAAGELRGAAYLAVLVAVPLGVFALGFRRRDVG